MELIGTIQFRMNGLRGSPVSIFMEQGDGEVRISIRLPQWKHIVGTGATVNKAAANFEANLKAALPSEEAYDGPYWNGGIKPEKPAPPKPAAPAPVASTAQPLSEGSASPPAPPPAPQGESEAVSS
jgi:hypothetical protein